VTYSADDLVRAVKEAGLRATAQRVAILDVLRTAQGHLSVDQVTDLVRSRLGTVSQQAVYDALGALVSGGLARRIEPAGHPALFESRVGDNHHHVVCRRCGTVADIDCVVGAAPCLDPSETHGFLLDEAEITFWGLCPDCQPPLDGAA
jgi:Fur family transcriptional regulator, stress-responsive regulator